MNDVCFGGALFDDRHAAYREHLRRHGFVLERELGSGFSGHVWKAHQPNLKNRPVAVKFCDTIHARKDSDVRARFIREATLLTRCQHPRIPYILTRGVIEENDTPYIVMEYVDGDTLADVFAQEGTMSPQEALKLILPVLDALAHVHRHDVVHRDVTPNNIMITEHGPMLIDFSIGTDARRVGEGPTRTNQRLGTPDYAAPEQLTDAKSVGPQADVYSTAVILYELMTGHVRFKRKSAKQLLPDVPDDFLTVLELARDKVSFLRPDDASKFRDELRPYVRAPQSVWEDTVPLTICQNLSCWGWDNWNGGTWMPTYDEETDARHCPQCGEEVLRYCPGCFGPLTTERFCSGCGEEFYQLPTCDSCGDLLSWNAWKESRNSDASMCSACRRPNAVVYDREFDDDDIPF